MAAHKRTRPFNLEAFLAKVGTGRTIVEYQRAVLSSPKETLATPSITSGKAG